MKLQHLLIGLFFTSSLLLEASSYEEARQYLHTTIKQGSLIEQFIKQPEEFEAGLGPDIIDQANINLTPDQMPTKEQLLRRVNFGKEIRNQPDLIAPALIWACEHNAPICSSLIISTGITPNINVAGLFDSPITPLCLAADNTNAALIIKLYALGADVNYPCVSGEVPLHFAAASGCMTTILQLLAYKANPNAVRADGASPLHVAAAKSFPNAVKALLYYGADPNLKTNLGSPPICLAALSKNIESLEALIDGGAEINEAAADGRTALHIAAHLGLTTHVQLLLTRGADMFARTQYQQDPLFLAAVNGHTGVVQLLLDWSKKTRAVSIRVQ